MAVTHALAHSHPGQPVAPSAVLQELNQKLARMYTTEGAFVTAFYGVYDSSSGHLLYSSAVHNPPRLLRQQSVISLDSSSGLPLGVLEDGEFGESSVNVEPGDVLVLYTDGITEAFSPEPERRLWGVNELDGLLAAQRDRSAQGIVDAVVARVDEHRRGGAPTDDRTLLVMR
jgi:sigma-B regulation protein RsbU (phosphoserine phosphatase)